jgi:predicted transcriptional regulator
METYFETLQAVADRLDVDLRTAFSVSGVPISTFYRSAQRNDMRHKTAMKVLNAIKNIHASKESCAS